MWMKLRQLGHSVAIAVALGHMAWAQTSGEAPQRARLPTWKRFPSEVFFKDAFQEALVGSRPNSLGTRSSKSKPEASEPSPNAPTSQRKWSQVVSAETLEDEVKSLQISVDRHVATPGRFSSGGHQDVRREFTELAALFAVIAEFEGKVRWQKEAPTARDSFARAAANAKVTSVQAFQEAKQRKLDLQELVRGGSIKILKSAAREAPWQDVCDRAPLMERFTACYDDGVAIWTANADGFKSKKRRIKHEAELLKLFSVILTKEGMEDAGDEDYEAYCRQLAAAAEALLRAVEKADPKAAREAVSDIGKSCNGCHEDYRG